MLVPRYCSRNLVGKALYLLHGGLSEITFSGYLCHYEAVTYRSSGTATKFYGLLSPLSHPTSIPFIYIFFPDALLQKLNLVCINFIVKTYYSPYQIRSET